MAYLDSTTILACRQELETYVMYFRDNILHRIGTQYANAWDHGIRPFVGASENMTPDQHDLLIYSHQIACVQNLLAGFLTLHRRLTAQSKPHHIDIDSRLLEVKVNQLSIWFPDDPDMKMLVQQVKVLTKTVRAGSTSIPTCPYDIGESDPIRESRPRR